MEKQKSGQNRGGKGRNNGGGFRGGGRGGATRTEKSESSAEVTGREAFEDDLQSQYSDYAFSDFTTQTGTTVAGGRGSSKNVSANVSEMNFKLSDLQLDEDGDDLSDGDDQEFDYDDDDSDFDSSLSSGSSSSDQVDLPEYACRYFPSLFSIHLLNINIFLYINEWAASECGVDIVEFIMPSA